MNLNRPQWTKIDLYGPQRTTIDTNGPHLISVDKVELKGSKMDQNMDQMDTNGPIAKARPLCSRLEPLVIYLLELQLQL